MSSIRSASSRTRYVARCKLVRRVSNRSISLPGVAMQISEPAHTVVYNGLKGALQTNETSLSVVSIFLALLFQCSISVGARTLLVLVTGRISSPQPIKVPFEDNDGGPHLSLE